jgi:hypothetical protein
LGLIFFASWTACFLISCFVLATRCGAPGSKATRAVAVFEDRE